MSTRIATMISDIWRHAWIPYVPFVFNTWRGREAYLYTSDGIVSVHFGPRSEKLEWTVNELSFRLVFKGRQYVRTFTYADGKEPTIEHCTRLARAFSRDVMKYFKVEQIGKVDGTC